MDNAQLPPNLLTIIFDKNPSFLTTHTKPPQHLVPLLAVSNYLPFHTFPILGQYCLFGKTRLFLLLLLTTITMV
jgi:hypothetical protein